MENSLTKDILFFNELKSDLYYYFEDDDIDEINPTWAFDVEVSGDYYGDEPVVIQVSFPSETEGVDWYEKILNSEEPVAVPIGGTSVN